MDYVRGGLPVSRRMNGTEIHVSGRGRYRGRFHSPFSPVGVPAALRAVERSTRGPTIAAVTAFAALFHGISPIPLARPSTPRHQRTMEFRRGEKPQPFVGSRVPRSEGEVPATSLHSAMRNRGPTVGPRAVFHVMMTRRYGVA